MSGGGSNTLKLTILHLHPLEAAVDDFNAITVHSLAVILAYKRATSRKKPEVASDEKKVRSQKTDKNWLAGDGRWLTDCPFRALLQSEHPFASSSYPSSSFAAPSTFDPTASSFATSEGGFGGGVGYGDSYGGGRGGGGGGGARQSQSQRALTYQSPQNAARGNQLMVYNAIANHELNQSADVSDSMKHQPAVMAS